MQKRILGLYWQTAFRYKRLFFLNIFFGPSTLILERYIAPLAIAALFQMIQQGNVTIEKAIWLLAGYGSIQFYTQVIGYRVNLYAYWQMANKGAVDLYNLSFKTLLRQSAQFYSNEFEGALVARASRFANAFENFWSTFVYQLLFLVTSIIATMIGIGFISLSFMFILLVLTITFMIVAFFGNKKMRKAFEDSSEATSKITAHFADNLSNILAIKAESADNDESMRIGKTVNEWSQKNTVAMRQFLTFSSVFAAIISTMKIFSLVAAILLVSSSQVNAAIVYLLITFTLNLIEEIWNFNSFFRNYTTVLADAKEMVAIIDSPIEIKDEESSHLKISKGSIDFINISYGHNRKQDQLYSNFNLNIKGGQKIGLVGRSGSGKTTLTNLLLRFMDVNEGSIRIDGQNIRAVTQNSLHKAIAYVSQDPLLFHRSIYENIAYSRPSATKKQIIDAAKKAHAWEFISELPDGLETLVGERGVKLSGGQRQRIAIARAILKDAPVLILDEATSALDSESERLIQDALKRLMKNRTSIVIAHRLSTISHLDHIVVLDKGTIIEEGQHKTLIKQKGTYADLWSHQTGGFIEE